MNLSPHHISTLQNLFAKHPSIKEALLFGSRALGTHRESSDIDIALKGDISPTLIAHLKEELEDSTLPYFCDIISYEKAPKKLKESIDSHALPLYTKEVQWQEARLGELVEIIGGGTPKTSIAEYWNGDIPWLSIADFNNDSKFVYQTEKTITLLGLEKSSTKMLKKGDIIFSARGTIGAIAMLGKDMAFNQSCYGIRAKKEIDRHYLYYLLKSLKPLFHSNAYGSVFDTITKENFSQIIVSLPPLERQREIAEILSSFDDKIDFLHRQNKTLESLAQTLFHHYFIENAKEEWEEGSLSEWIEDTLGGDWGKELPSKDYDKKVFCFRGTDIADLNNGLPTKIPLRYIKESKLKKIEPKNGDILFEISGGTETQSTGRATYINENVKALFNSPIVFSNFCRLLVVKDEDYSFFVFLYLKYLYNNDEFFAYENGSSGIKNLDYKSLLTDSLIKIPPQEEIIKFNDEVSKYFYKIDRNKKEIQRLNLLANQGLFLLDSKNK